MHDQGQPQTPGCSARFRARTVRRHLVSALAALALLLVPASAAQAARPLELGFTSFSDGLFVNADPAVRNLWLGRATDAGAGMVLLGAHWRNMAPQNPTAAFDPRDPASPGYSFQTLDAAVRDATAHGLKVMIVVTNAPSWAEGPDNPHNGLVGTWKPNPGDVADFGTAIATRYSGRFVDPASPQSGPLPAVRLWQLWGEPNLSVNLTPQYENGNAVAAEVYRLMLNAFYPAVKAVDPHNKVVTGGLAPYGDPPGGFRFRTRPLAFLRQLLCLHGRKHPHKTQCSAKPSFDVLADNPITLGGGPRTSAINPDDVSSADLGNVRDVLRAAERAHTINPGGKHPLWATEFWWASNPPAAGGVRPARQARWVVESLYLYWKAGASAAIMLQIKDNDLEFLGGTGLYFADGRPKPSLTAFRFPFVAERRSKRSVALWGKAPTGGKLQIRRRSSGHWRTIKKLHVRRGSVFSTRARFQGGAKLEARVGGQESLVWKLGH